MKFSIPLNEFELSNKILEIITQSHDIDYFTNVDHVFEQIYLMS